MLLITGATGTVGGEVLRLLVGKGQPVRAMTRDRARLPASAGYDVVQADYEDPDSLRRAVDGVETVFLLTAPEFPTARHDTAMLDAARSTGVARVVRLSAIGSGEIVDGDKILGAWHARAEQAVRSSGLAWTLLRPSTFASNVLWWADTINAADPIPNLTGSGVQGVVDPRDVAAVAVETLLSPIHAGQTYTLTGPQLLSVPDQASQLERVLGRPVRTVDEPLDAARRRMLSSGMHESFVDAVLTGSAWVRAGHNAIVTHDVPRILGRPATSFETWAKDHRHAFAPRRR
jgi:uncharacterized protein YbjT (DUF2867 family)